MVAWVRNSLFTFFLLVFFVLLVGIAGRYFNLLPTPSTDDCTTNPAFNINVLKGSVSAKQTKLNGDHRLTLISYDPKFTFSLQESTLFASKLQQLAFWDSSGILETRSGQSVRPQHLCIIATPIEQPYGQFVDSLSGEIIQSSSTEYDANTETLKLKVFFNPIFYGGKSTNKLDFGFSVSYEIMSVLFDITRDRTNNEQSLDERFAGADEFLASFVSDQSSGTKSVFRIDRLDWEKSQ